MAINSEEVLRQATESLKRIQEFDTSSLPRKKELGSELNFVEAVEPAQQLVELCKRLSVSALQDFPDQELGLVRDDADSIHRLFSQVLDFKTAQQNPKSIRQGIITDIEISYSETFQKLHPLIAYSLHRAADFQRLDAEARATLQSITEQANDFGTSMQTHKESAKTILEDIQKVAAEQGVSQQAVYFKNEASLHNGRATQWKWSTIGLAIVLGLYAIASLWVHQLPGLEPSDLYQSIQFVTSKILVFGVIAYMLVLSARNFLSHQHNAIVNTHRHNALLTFQVLADAAKEEVNRDIVLNHASSCIFSPQETGYTKAGGHLASGTHPSLIELLRKTVMKSDA